MGAAFVTTSIDPQVSGYRDEIDVLVGIDLEGKITGAKVVGHRETPELMQRVLDSGYLSRFVGRIAGDDFGDIEAITGATVTSQAIANDIRTAQAEDGRLYGSRYSLVSRRSAWAQSTNRSVLGSRSRRPCVRKAASPRWTKAQLR